MLLVPVVVPDADEPLVALALRIVISARMLPVELVLRNAPESGAMPAPVETEVLVIVDGVALVPAAGVDASVAAPAVGALAADALLDVEVLDAAPEDADALNGAMEPDHWFWPNTEL